MKQSIEYIRINPKRLLIKNPAGLDTYLALAATREKDGRQLYCSELGEFYSLSKLRGLNKIGFSFTPYKIRARRGTCYPKIAGFGKEQHCHHFMWQAWIGPRTMGMEIDHVNGNIYDWRLENLQEVTPRVNRERAKILRKLREIAYFENAPALLPENRPISQIKQIFKQNNL